MNLGHMGSKTRSVCQIEEKSCLHSMKLGQNVCLDDVWVRLGSGSRGVKT